MSNDDNSPILKRLIYDHQLLVGEPLSTRNAKDFLRLRLSFETH